MKIITLKNHFVNALICTINDIWKVRYTI